MSPPARALPASLAAALGWLRDSGIQAGAGAGADAGGVYAWLDGATGRPSYLYSEITGYFITLCVKLDRLGLGADWLPRARAAATWIVERAEDPREPGAILGRRHADPADEAADEFSFARRRVPFFDAAIAGYGLVALHRADGDPRWLAAARRIAAFLERAFLAGGPPAHATWDLAAGAPVAPGPRWSRHFGPFELKAALFLDALAAVTGEARLAAHVDAILARALAAQQPDGRFPTHPDGDATHLHPHCYTLEGLAALIARRGRRDLAGPLARGATWMYRTCLATEPPIQEWSKQSGHIVRGIRSDVIAQALRVQALLDRLAPDEPHIPAPAWLAGALARHVQANGGTAYGEDDHGVRLTHSNAWCHFFRVDLELPVAREDLECQNRHAPDFLVV
jgi:hypothetical protein